MEIQAAEERPLREWVTPAFECAPLNEALFSTGTTIDGDGYTVS